MAEIRQEVPIIGVCVGKEQRGVLALQWALQENLVPPQGSVYLLHVRPPLRWIPNPMGGKLPVDQVNPEMVKRFQNDRLLETKELVDNYRKICDKHKVASKLCYSENDSVQIEIVDQISKLGITKLVLEVSSQNVITRALKKEGISAHVAKHAPNFCTVIVIRDGKLYSIKEATQSPPLLYSARSSSSAASDGCTSIFSKTSNSSGEFFEDHLIRSGGFQNEERDVQSGHLSGISDLRHLRSSTMDISQGSRLMPLNSDIVGYQSPAASLMMRNYSAPPQTRSSLKFTPATPFYYWSRPDNDNARPSTSESESRESVARDVGPLEESSPDSNSEGHGVTTPPRVPLEDLDGPSTSSLAASESINRTMDLSELIDALPQTSMGMGNTTNTSIGTGSLTNLRNLEESSAQLTLPHVHESDLMVSSTAFASNEVLPPGLELDFLQIQLNEAKQAAELAQREAERQANDFRMVERVAASARKMIAKHERDRDEALSGKLFALQRASDFEKRWEQAVATAQTLEERLAQEVRRHQETQIELETQKRMVESYAMAADLAKQQAQAEGSRCEEALLKLEEVTRKLEEECQLRREAEERASEEAIAKRQVVMALRREQQKYSEYSFEELQSATSNFHEDNKLGQGGYGPVYKGTLHRTPVAIKVLAREGTQGREEFQREVELLSHIHHPHMVMLRGSCPEKGCIVYEYMANGSLEDRLKCRDGSPPLPWYVRFRICLEVATALLFLHSRPQPIVHRDIKPGNILLDHHFVSKIGDVGLAKLVPKDLTFSVTVYKESVLVGTFAYMDPDYLRTGVVSPESDVYSLGIVILQLLTGRQAVGIVEVVEDAVGRQQLVDVLDQSAGEWPLKEAMVLACLGLQCVEDRRKSRANLETKILPELESIQGIAGIAAANMASAGQSSPGRMPIIPGSFFCPILQEIMKNPHLAADGFTYEYDAIKVWLWDHNTSPMTNIVLIHNNLIPNHSLRSAIEEWHGNGLIYD